MCEEKRCSAVTHEAEVTSLRLQLDRCRAELAHYTAEANRLSQQLRMKNHHEEEQYKRHLENKVRGAGLFFIGTDRGLYSVIGTEGRGGSVFIAAMGTDRGMFP